MAEEYPALAQRRKNLNESMLRLSNTVVNSRLITSRTQMYLGNYHCAIEHAETVLDELLAQHGQNHPLVAKVYLELAEMYRKAGMPEESANCANAAQQVLRRMAKSS